MCGCGNLSAMAQLGTLSALYCGIHIFRRDIRAWVEQGLCIAVVVAHSVPAAIALLLMYFLCNLVAISLRLVKPAKVPNL